MCSLIKFSESVREEDDDDAEDGARREKAVDGRTDDVAAASVAVTEMTPTAREGRTTTTAVSAE